MENISLIPLPKLLRLDKTQGQILQAFLMKFFLFKKYVETHA